MKKFLITGGSGFIGCHLIKALAKDSDNTIYVLDLKDCPIKSPNISFIKCDIRENEGLNQILIEKVDYCIHLAALCKEPGYDWEAYFETNTIGTKNVIELCERSSINNIIFTSTMMVYKAGEFVRTESSMTAPDTAYGISKLLAEKELLLWKEGNAQNKNLVIIRPAVVFGENENGNFTRLYKSLKRGFFPYVGRKTTVKSAVYVRELVNFVQFALDKRIKSNVFNFAFPKQNNMKEIVFSFKLIFDCKSYNPVIPYKMLYIVSFIFEFLDSIGIRNPIHHRRIQKLYFSSNIFPENVLRIGYKFKYDIVKALEDWKNSDDEHLRS